MKFISSLLLTFFGCILSGHSFGRWEKAKIKDIDLDLTSSNLDILIAMANSGKLEKRVCKVCKKKELRRL